MVPKVSAEFMELIKEINEKGKEFKITPRKLLAAFDFERRTAHNRNVIDNFLAEHQVEVEPSYVNTWVEGVITIRQKQRALRIGENDPIHRIKLLQAANTPPQTISSDENLEKAVTVMMMNNFSQLPVMGGPRNVVGVITWETIGSGLANNRSSKLVKDYSKKTCTILDEDTPLREAISIVIKEEFVLVQKKDKSLGGIVTMADISSQFLNLTEPFLLLEQIENHIRRLLHGKLLLDVIRKITNDPSVACIDDLSFGDYIRIFENKDHWSKLKLSIDRSEFVNHMQEIRKIRNDIMHFDPEGITEPQRQSLLQMAIFLEKIQQYTV